MSASHKKRGLVILISISGFVILLILVNEIYKGFSEIQEALEESLPISYKLSPEDSSLIDSSYWKEIKVDAVFRSTRKLPASFLTVNSQYSLFINQLVVDKKIELDKLFKIEHKNISSSVGYVYSEILINPLFKFKYYSNAVKFAEKIHLSFYGDSMGMKFSGDSVLAYRLLCKNFSLRYQISDPIDIFMERKPGFLGLNSGVNTEILFLKRNGSVYLFILTPNEPNVLLPKDLLYRILTGV